jgi:hypothetical protein
MTIDSSAVIAIEARYPYLSGHTFVRTTSRSGACIFCGCFREQHPIARQGNEEPVSERTARGLLKELSERH